MDLDLGQRVLNRLIAPDRPIFKDLPFVCVLHRSPQKIVRYPDRLSRSQNPLRIERIEERHTPCMFFPDDVLCRHLDVIEIECVLRHPFDPTRRDRFHLESFRLCIDHKEREPVRLWEALRLGLFERHRPRNEQAIIGHVSAGDKGFLT